MEYITVGLRIPKPLYDLIGKARWKLEKNKTEILREALTEYLEKRGFTLESLEAPREKTKRDSNRFQKKT